VELLAKLESWPLSQWVAGSLWGYPIVLCFHSIGMALVVGVVLMLGLRVLGYARGIPLSAFETLFQFAWAGFALNAGSGVLLFIANGPALITNWTFVLKIVLIAIGSGLLYGLWRRVQAEPNAMQPDGVFTPATRGLAAATVLCWLGAVTSGRYIAYVLGAALEAAYQ
jgi:hypothetical protein